MNILEQTERLKDLPDQALIKEMQMPTGMAAPIFITTELKRRQRIRDEFKRREAQDMPTVAEEVVMAAGVPQQGIMQMAKSMAPKTNMGQNTGMADMMPKQPTMGMSSGGVVKMQPGGMMSNIMSLMAPPSYNMSRLGSLDEPKQTGLEDFAEQNPNPQVQRRMEILRKARAGKTLAQIAKELFLDTADIVNVVAGGASLLVTDTAALAGDVAGIVTQAAGLPNTAEGIFGVSQDLREYGRDQFTRPEDELFSAFGETYYTPRLVGYRTDEKRKEALAENLRRSQGLTTPEQRAEIAAQSEAAINRASPETLGDTGEAVPFTGTTDLLSVIPEGGVMADSPELGAGADPMLLGNVPTTLDDILTGDSGLKSPTPVPPTAPDLSAIPEDMAQDQLRRFIATEDPQFYGPEAKAMGQRAREFYGTDTFTPPSEIYGDVTKDKLQETPPALSNLFAQTVQNQQAGIPGGTVPVLNDPTNEMQNMIVARETEAAEEAARRELNEFLSQTNTEGQPGGTVPDTTSFEARKNRARKYFTNLGDDIKNMTKEDVINGFLSIGGQLSDLKDVALEKFDDLTDTAAEKVNELKEYFKSAGEDKATGKFDSVSPSVKSAITGTPDSPVRPKIRPKDLGKKVPGSASNVPVEARIAELMAKRQKSAEQDKWLALAKTGVIMSSGDPADLRRAGETGIKALQTSRAQKDKYDAAMLGLQAKIDAYKARIAKPTTIPATALTVLQKEIENAQAAIVDQNKPTDAEMQKVREAQIQYDNAIALFFAQQGLSTTQTAQANGRESFNFSDTT